LSYLFNAFFHPRRGANFFSSAAPPVAPGASSPNTTPGANQCLVQRIAVRTPNPAIRGSEFVRGAQTSACSGKRAPSRSWALPRTTLPSSSPDTLTRLRQCEYVDKIAAWGGRMQAVAKPLVKLPRR
jgi:hypothetical protein